MGTKDVIDRHLAAFGSGDVDDVLSDYSEDSVILTMEGPVAGLAAIRALFEEFLAGPFAPGTYEIHIDQMDVHGDAAFLVWSGSCPGFEIPFGTDTFVVRDDKILAQSIGAKMEPVPGG